MSAVAGEEVGTSFIGSSQLNGRVFDFWSATVWACLVGSGLVLSVAELDGLDGRALSSKNRWERGALGLGCEGLGDGICRG